MPVEYRTASGNLCDHHERLRGASPRGAENPSGSMVKPLFRPMAGPRNWSARRGTTLEDFSAVSGSPSASCSAAMAFGAAVAGLDARTTA